MPAATTVPVHYALLVTHPTVIQRNVFVNASIAITTKAFKSLFSSNLYTLQNHTILSRCGLAMEQSKKNHILLHRNQMKFQKCTDVRIRIRK